MSEDVRVRCEDLVVDEQREDAAEPLPVAYADLVAGRPCDAFALLGPHQQAAGWQVTVWLPGHAAPAHSCRLAVGWRWRG
jgi:hypothetical protein